jgi:RNA polymerase sigma-70 factor, ECF subfamily
VQQHPSSDGSVTDEGGELLESAVEIRQLIRDHHADVYRYAFRLCGSQNDAEDLVQQTFLAAQQKLHQLREPEKVRSWLLTIVRNAYFKQRRLPAPEPACNLELEVDRIPDQSIPPAGAEAEWIDRQWLQGALEQLSDEHKEVLLMFYFEELSYKQIAERLDVAIGTVMSRLARAKDRLRALLDPPEGETAPGAKAPRANMFV